MAELFLQFIQRAKKRVWSVDEAIDCIAQSPDSEPRVRLFHTLALRAYREYEAMLAEQSAMDFDDVLIQAIDEINTRGPAAGIHVGEGRFVRVDDLRWILLDEYQDFSELYSRLLNAILNVNRDVRLVAVGDDWQAINGFAGAELRFFENFSEFFPGAHSVCVTTNYRSDSLVVAIGNRLMKGRGPLAKRGRSDQGEIEIQNLSDFWIEFRQGAQHDVARTSDLFFLPNVVAGTNPSAATLRLAQALKACVTFISRNPYKKTMLLARTNTAYGLDLQEFRRLVISIVSALLNIPSKNLEESIQALTTHGSKGQEADTVIIIDATERQFPKLHPDNFLFGIFGVTPHSILEEERRLFYVAMTRAEHRLVILTEKDRPSPFISLINTTGDNDFDTISESILAKELGPLAQDIRARLSNQDCSD